MALSQDPSINLVGFPKLNKYECGLHTPPMDKLVKLSEVFDTTIDFLCTGNRTEERPLHNLRLLERLQELEDFASEDQETITKLIDAMIEKRKVEGAIKPFEKINEIIVSVLDLIKQK